MIATAAEEVFQICFDDILAPRLCFFLGNLRISLWDMLNSFNV